MIKNWPNIGVVLQGTAIDGGGFGADVYLEVESKLDDGGDPVVPATVAKHLPYQLIDALTDAVRVIARRRR